MFHQECKKIECLVQLGSRIRKLLLNNHLSNIQECLGIDQVSAPPCLAHVQCSEVCRSRCHPVDIQARWVFQKRKPLCRHLRDKPLNSSLEILDRFSIAFFPRDGLRHCGAKMW